jgi:hypothetical protein
MSSRRLLGGRRTAGTERIGGAAPETTRLPAQPALAEPAVPPQVDVPILGGGHLMVMDRSAEVEAAIRPCLE